MDVAFWLGLGFLIGVLTMLAVVGSFEEFLHRRDEHRMTGRWRRETWRQHDDRWHW